MKKYFLLIIVVLLCAAGSFSQQRKCQPSQETDKPAIGANENTAYFGVRKVKKMQGTVRVSSSTEGLDAIIEIYRTGRLTNKTDPVDMVSDKTPLKRYKTGKDGVFCIDGLPDADYIIKIGTGEFAFNLAFLKIRISSGGSKKSLDIGLSPGT